MYLYESLGALRLVAANSKSVGHSHQLSQRPGSHFFWAALQYMGSVYTNTSSTVHCADV
jgi:hypothetical protein